MDRTVRPIGCDDGASRRFDEFLPPIPFSGFLVASKGDGKTTVIANLLEMYQQRGNFKAFDQIFVISSTVNTDNKWEHLRNSKIINAKDSRDEFDEKHIEDIYKKIKKKNENKKNIKKKSYLFIFDDVADKLPRTRQNILKTFCFNHRHFFISFLLVSQSFTEIPPYARCNPSFWILFRSESAEEHDKISSTVRGHLPKHKFNEILLKATEEKYSFLMVDYSYKHDERMKFRKNIDEMLDLGSKKFKLDGEEKEKEVKPIKIKEVKSKSKKNNSEEELEQVLSKLEKDKIKMDEQDRKVRDETEELNKFSNLTL